LAVFLWTEESSLSARTEKNRQENAQPLAGLFNHPLGLAERVKRGRQHCHPDKQNRHSAGCLAVFSKSSQACLGEVPEKNR
jgi:hypothetical protein